MRFVPLKNPEQQSVLTLHTARQSFVQARSAQANQIRGLLLEFGLIVPQGIRHLYTRVPELIEDASNELPGRFRLLVQRLMEHLKDLEDFKSALAKNRLPAVSFVKQAGEYNEHPGYADLYEGQKNLVELVEAATGVNLWAEWAKVEIAGGKAPYRSPEPRLPRAQWPYSAARLARFGDLGRCYKRRACWPGRSPRK